MVGRYLYPLQPNLDFLNQGNTILYIVGLFQNSIGKVDCEFDVTFFVESLRQFRLWMAVYLYPLQANLVSRGSGGGTVRGNIIPANATEFFNS